MRRGTLALLHVAALAVVVAGIAHIVVVFLVPALAPRDAWARLSAVTQPWRFGVLARPIGASAAGPVAGLALPGLDPRFAVAACRFDLREGPASIEADGNVPFWSLAVFDRRGEIRYSFNDRTAIDGRLDLVILTPSQRAQLREDPPDGIENSILVNVGLAEGFAVVRAMAPDETWAPAAARYVEGASCSRLELAPIG